MSFINILNDCPGVVRHFNERLGIIKEKSPHIFPDFSKAQSVLSISDYSGENGDTFFQALSFLIMDWNNAGLWEAQRLAFRYNQLDFKRDMEFKKLNKDKERRRLLDDFLECCDSINGISMTFLIHKNIKYMFTEKSPHSILEEMGLGVWKPHIAEKILRVCHLQAPLVYGLTNQDNKFLWLTDRDAITKDIKKLGEIFEGIFNTYATHKFRAFGYAEPYEDKTKQINDLLSIPDLIAGAILEYHNQSEKAKSADQEGFEIQDKSDSILQWLCNTGSSLKKLVCVISPNGKVWNFSFLDLEKK